jgi:Ca2+-transporting ATPase
VTEAQAWHSLSAQRVAASLETDLERGLQGEEAARRLLRIGPNELAEKPRPHFLALLLSQFNNFLILILLAAAMVSTALGEFLDAGAIVLIVILNAVLGVIQESKAEEALAALKKMAAPDARVLRGSATLSIPARELVPGDLVMLEAGGYVPADLRLVETANLRVEEASLTGESVPVEKSASAVMETDALLGDRRTMAFLGTMVSFGRGRGIVVETGMRTQIGLIARMIQEDEGEDTPLQKKLSQMGKWLGIGALAICAFVFLAGVIEGRDLLTMFLTSVSLAIAAVPEGLPAIVTICLALGMREMIKRHALIRKLPAVETLGSATVICTDKTGTLTQNEMTVSRLYADGEMLSVTGEGYQPLGEVRKDGARAELRDYSSVRLLLQSAMLASDAHLEMIEEGEAAGRWRMVGDPTEGALVVAAGKTGLRREKAEALFPREAEIPFDSERKRMTTLHRAPRSPAHGEKEAVPMTGSFPCVALVKGAPDLILERCSAVENRGEVRRLTPEDRRDIIAVNGKFASEALRVLAVAYRPLDALPASPAVEEVEKDLIFVGLIGMMDPARPEAAGAIDTARKAGLKVIMVTGDYRDTAAAVGRSIGLVAEGDTVLSGADIDAADDESFSLQVERTGVFARVSPQHKVRIVDSLKKRGHIVGMTGDGVNDAPALKRADIGISMGITGTDVAKETADMILTDDNFASIISAVEQGRIIFSNIRKFVFYLISCNLGEIGTVLLGTLFGWPLPLTAIQLLWTNLITDGAPALALGLEKGEPDIMRMPPRPTTEPIIGRAMLLGLALQTLAITSVSLFAFWLGFNVLHSVDAARTMAFVTLSGCQLVRAYTNRSERASLFSIGVFSNKWMQYAALSSTVLLLAVIYIPFINRVFNVIPLGLSAWGYLIPLILLPAVIDELTKLGMRRADTRRSKRRTAASRRGG